MAKWSSLAGRKLGELVSKTINHLETVTSAVEVLEKLVHEYPALRAEDLREYFNRINTYEHEADNIKRDVMKELRLGYLHPLDREDILRLITMADDIAAYTKATARRLLVFHRLGFEIPVDIHEDLKNIMTKTLDASKTLLSALRNLNENVDEVLVLVEQVEEREEEIDDIRMDALEKLYNLCIDRVDARCILLKEIIDDMETISDKCEDTGDVIRIIAVSLT